MSDMSDNGNKPGLVGKPPFVEANPNLDSNLTQNPEILEMRLGT